MNPDLEKNLQSLKEDVEIYKSSIREVSEEMLSEKITKYPIFIAHKIIIPFGELIIDHAELATNWSISVSTFEEFSEKNIIEKSKEGFFKANYKNPNDFICIFMIDSGNGNFVFIPFKK